MSAAWLVAVVVFLLAALLRSRRVAAGRYDVVRAWCLALAYFAACIGVASAVGVLHRLATAPLISGDQLRDPLWWSVQLLCWLVIVVGYGVIWPRGTFHDGRRSRRWVSGVYGAVWGLSQGLWFASLWSIIGFTGWSFWITGPACFLVIATYNGLWHQLFWDRYVSPPHNYSEWNARKVLWCHTPNLVVSLSMLGLYGNLGCFVLLQTLALSLSAMAMRFPAFWDRYEAEMGKERSLLRKGVG